MGKLGVRVRIIVGTALALVTANAGLAQSIGSGPAARGGAPDSSLMALNAAAFVPTSRAPAIRQPDTEVALMAGAAARAERPLDVAAANLAAGPFATPRANDREGVSLLEGTRYDTGHGVATQWDETQFILPARSRGAVDSLRLSVASPSLIPGLGPRDLAAERFTPDAFDVTLTRGWPQAVKFEAAGMAVDFSPHAGVGVGNRGGSAEAGAVVTLGQEMEDRVADALGGGVKNGKQFGNRDRWYLFAAASGRAVGLNMLRQEGDWSSGGWSQDPTSSLVGDAQVGLGWRKGAMQTSFGYVHRKIKMKEAVMGLDTQEDSVVAFSFSFKPHQ